MQHDMKQWAKIFLGAALLLFTILAWTLMGILIYSL